jgi:hypothetical protein
MYDELDDKELYSDEYPVEFFYIWETNLDSYNIYRTIRPYLKEGQLSSCSHLIPHLVNEKAAKLEKVLQDIPLIHSGYMSVTNPAPEEEQKATNPPEEETVLTF